MKQSEQQKRGQRNIQIIRNPQKPQKHHENHLTMKTSKNPQNDFRKRLFCLALALIILAPFASAARIIGLNQMQNDQGLSLNSTTLNIFTSNTSRVYITQAGLVGIGTASPGQK